MKNVLFLMPIYGNGGIKSWAQKLVADFPYSNIHFLPVDTSHVEVKVGTRLGHYISIWRTMRRIIRDMKKVASENKIDIVHSTTSGALGSLRDIIVGRFCRKNGLKSIMHCHYGCVVSDYKSRGLYGFLLRKSLPLYDQIWVLERGICDFLQDQPGMRGKVFLTPNSIEVSEPLDATPKNYHKVAFIGNLDPTKGTHELVQAIKKCEGVTLDVVGPGSDEQVAALKQLAGEELDKRIRFHGRLPNKEAIQFMKSVDIVALPTYFRFEAFPISILEAMSLSKMVISTRRAAIPDMLTALDGSECGLLVPERSIDGIVDAIGFCHSNPEKADSMCRKAYEKVNEIYRKEKVFKLYYDLYSKLLS